jgi:hypothetical protein
MVPSAAIRPYPAKPEDVRHTMQHTAGISNTVIISLVLVELLVQEPVAVGR